MRTKRNPLNEGSLKEISVFLINPSIRRLLNPEATWQVDQVSVTRYKTKIHFRMPGLFYVAGAVKIQGLGYREVSVDTTLWVREDKRTNLVDVEFNGGHGASEQVFALSKAEWSSIQKYLNLVDKQ